ncbi:MAG: thioredoxin [Muribaculaceae bacterium]|nr:thioredoxin [Muribaculaceae bacterium]
MKSRILKTIVFSIIGLFLLASCKGNQNEKTSEVVPATEASDIEVIYFFGNLRCSSCVAMQKYAKEAIDSAFADQIKDGIINFKSVDITTPEGEKLADLFEVSSSSLYIVDNNPDKPEKVDMTAFGFRNARTNRQVYKQGIIDQINKFLD